MDQIIRHLLVIIFIIPWCLGLSQQSMGQDVNTGGLMIANLGEDGSESFAGIRQAFIKRNPDFVLRTHTSSVQVRVMEKEQPPIRVLAPGRVYRNEAISARAHCFFHQVEGLVVDEGINGFVVPVKDATALASALEKLVNAKDLVAGTKLVKDLEKAIEVLEGRHREFIRHIGGQFDTTRVQAIQEKAQKGGAPDNNRGRNNNNQKKKNQLKNHILLSS